MSGDPSFGAERRRARAERLALGALTHRDRGERATQRALESLPAPWRVFHEVAWPGRRGAHIDHVAVGPSGVFVIASQCWSGQIRVDEDVLREDGRSRERAVASVAEAALQVGQMSSRLAVTHPVICVDTDDAVAGRSREVLLCSTASVVETLTSRGAVLTPAQVDAAADELAEQFRRTALAHAPAIPQPRRPGELDRPRQQAPVPETRSGRRIRISAAPRPPQPAPSRLRLVLLSATLLLALAVLLVLLLGG
jgi:hypothetical protein